MNELEQKYKKEELTPCELKELREKINSMSDSQLESSLYESWSSEELDDSRIDNSRIDDAQIEILKTRIDKNILPLQKRYSLYKRVAQMAAAVLLPIFIIATAYLYTENNSLTAKEIIITTEKGERATIVLPDGTKVTLNSESRLVYNSADYNRKERKIDFNGEGYFSVAKDERRPFFIDAKDLQVEVLGTTFNLLARSMGSTAELSLEEGSVQFLSLLTGKSVILKPNQRAVLDRAVGSINVIDYNDVTDASAWKRGEMIFRNVPFSEVLEKIGAIYDVKIVSSDLIDKTDLFTGTLSRTDINEVLEILEKSYHLKITLKGGHIYVSKQY